MPKYRMRRRKWYIVARYCLRISNRERHSAKGADDDQVQLQRAWKALFWGGARAVGWYKAERGRKQSRVCCGHRAKRLVRDDLLQPIRARECCEQVTQR